MSDLAGETTELLQTLIRNQCVNDGTADSGGERRNADVLATYLEGAGLDVERFTARSDRTSIVARIAGSDPNAPKLCLMGHTDVVPVNPDGWSRDPFGGELIDGEVWGRGALDMLCLTASMAAAMKELTRRDIRPTGDLIYFGVADEEAGSRFGAQWMIDHHWDAIACDYVVTELGGFVLGDGRTIGIAASEKGVAWRKLTIGGTPGHGSMPYKADNALVKAAEVVRRLASYAPKAQLDERWAMQVATSGLPADAQRGLVDPGRVAETFAQLPVGAARGLHSSCHTTLSCNVVRSGQKTNVIPDRVEIEVDIRTLPGVSGADATAMLRGAIGDLADEVEVSDILDYEASASSTATPMWEALSAHAGSVRPESEVQATMTVGFTDARLFRAKGVIAYGAGMFSPDINLAAVASRFHGNDERIDVASLGSCADLWIAIAQADLGPK